MSSLSLTVGVFLSVLCDNLLLTVVVPILPDLLRERTPENQKMLVHNSDSEMADHESCVKELFHLQMLKEDSMLGLLLSTKAIMQLLCNPIVGSVTLKVGYKYPLLIGNTVLMFCCLIFGFANSYIMFIIGRSCHGLASSLISVAGMALIAELYQNDEERTKFLGRIMSGAALGVLIGYPFGGLGYSLTGKTLPFVVIGSLAFVNICLYVKQFRKTTNEDDHAQANALDWLQKWYKRRISNEESAEEVIKLNANTALVPNSAGILNLLRDKSILIIAIAVWFSTTSMSILEPTLPIWLIETIDPPKWQLGIVFIPDSLGYFLGTNFFGQIARKFGRWKLSMVSMSVIGFACLLLPFGRNILQLAIPHFMLGIGLGVIDASLMPLLARIADEKHHAGYGVVYALAQTSVALAYSFGPLLGGQLVGLIGFPELIRSLGVINLLFCPCLSYLAKYENELQESSHYIPYQSLQNYHSMKVRGHHHDEFTSSKSLSGSTSHSSSIMDKDDYIGGVGGDCCDHHHRSEENRNSNSHHHKTQCNNVNNKKVRFNNRNRSSSCCTMIDNNIPKNQTNNGFGKARILFSTFCCTTTTTKSPDRNIIGPPNQQQPEYESAYKRFYDDLLDSD